ncbi:hypothetical protein PAHAL_5G372600 [Panicum hallii]|uniref:Glycosyltransferase family 28 N-terminal domain-containing protein n=2 Tax=Panicum hallii TaxID=206008 RepID=A0A2T8IMH7_9POAL|nr:hypothetical protein PAHAL_5G372600 [Panicum hallii]
MPQPLVVFPWLAFGHIIPFLELSEQLAKRGHFVTFVSAPRNLARLRPVVPEVRPRIRLAPLLLPRVEGLPGGAESTADVPPEKVELLKVAFDGLAAPFAAFLAGDCAGGEAGEGHGRKPDRIVLDFAQHWLPPIADEHGLRATLCTARSRASLPPPPSIFPPPRGLHRRAAVHGPLHPALTNDAWALGLAAWEEATAFTRARGARVPRLPHAPPHGRRGDDAWALDLAAWEEAAAFAGGP